MNEVLVIVKAHKVGGASRTCSWLTNDRDSHVSERFVENASVSEILH